MRQLSMQPLCQSCLTRGIVTPATEVDHVFPWRRIGPQAFYRNLFQSLCHDCHSSKTQDERRGVFIHWVGGKPVEMAMSDWTRLCGGVET